MDKVLELFQPCDHLLQALLLSLHLNYLLTKVLVHDLKLLILLFVLLDLLALLFWALLMLGRLELLSLEHFHEVVLELHYLGIEAVCNMSQLVVKLLPLLIPLQLKILRYLRVPTHSLVDLSLQLIDHNLML